LCKIPTEEFTTCCFEWSQNYEDPEPGALRGKKAEVSKYGAVTFVDVEVKQLSLDLNWRHLRTMTRPIVDEALGRHAGTWISGLVHGGTAPFARRIATKGIPGYDGE
jgi:hypothetical protein